MQFFYSSQGDNMTESTDNPLRTKMAGEYQAETNVTQPNSPSSVSAGNGPAVQHFSSVEQAEHQIEPASRRGRTNSDEYQKMKMKENVNSALQLLFQRIAREIEQKQPQNTIHFIVDFLCKHYSKHLHGFASIWNADPELEKERQEVVHFFKHHKISTQISAHFTNAGYDTLETLATLTTDTLADIEAFNSVKWLPGHKVRLQQVFSDIGERVREFRQRQPPLGYGASPGGYSLSPADMQQAALRQQYAAMQLAVQHQQQQALALGNPPVVVSPGVIAATAPSGILPTTTSSAASAPQGLHQVGAATVTTTPATGAAAHVGGASSMAPPATATPTSTTTTYALQPNGTLAAVSTSSAPQQLSAPAGFNIPGISIGATRLPSTSYESTQLLLPLICHAKYPIHPLPLDTVCMTSSGSP
ncbi:unnamed protein product, partial [Amoebophrya sp. A120]|eukprot:GSA120T00002095001.1